MSELTEYELDRQPQSVTEFELPLNSRLLHRELMCPICLDILNQTTTTRECLHRFCLNCINKAMRSNKKECPTCRKKLTGRRCLRPDPKFDQFIKLVYNSNQNGVTNHDEPSRKVDEKSCMAPALDCELILRHLNGEEARYIKCPLDGTIEHLCKWLALRPELLGAPDLESKREFKMCIAADRSKGKYDPLEVGARLDEIKSKYNLDMNKPLELYYFSPNKN